MAFRTSLAYVWRRRSAWTDTLPLGDRQPPARTLVIHYSASPDRATNEAGVRQIIRGFRDYHVKSNGWVDIGYNAVLAQTRRGWVRPRIFEARGVGRVPAAQQGANTGSFALCVIADDRTLIKSSTKRAIKQFMRDGGFTELRYHGEFNDTSCPGAQLERVVKALRP